MSAPSSDRAGIRQTIRALRDAGWVLVEVFDGEEDVPVSTETKAVDTITDVDDAFLHVAEGTATGQRGWVRFVMGNAPDEVICDHTINLGSVLDPLMDGWN